MKRNIFLFSLIIILALFSVMLSCENEIELSPKDQSPSIKGRITVPPSSGLSTEDIWLKVTDKNETKFVGKVKDDGTFEVRGLDPEIKYNILFSSKEPDYSNASREIKPRNASGEVSGYGGWISDVTAKINEGNDIGSVKMKPLGVIKGIVTLANSDEHFDIMIYIPGTSFMAMSDGDGSFSVSNVPQGTHSIRFSSPNYASKMMNDVVLHEADDSKNPVITLQPIELVKSNGELEGNALLGGALDHTGIVVKLEGEHNSEGTTSEKGNFHISDIIPGQYSAILSYPGYVPKRIENIVIKAGETTIIPDSVSLLASGGSVSGSVSLSDKAQAEGILVLAKSSDEKGYSYTSSTDVHGNFFINNCYPGDYTLTLSKTGYASELVNDVTVSAGNTTIVESVILEESSTSITGRIALEGSANNAGITVSAISSENEKLTFTTTTLDDGTYYLNNIQPGEYSIQAQASGYLTDRSQKITVKNGTTKSVDVITLKSITSTLLGQITLEGGVDHTGTTILLKASDDRDISYNTTTDQDGNYTLTQVMPGQYDLYASKEGFQTLQTKNVSVEPSVTKTLDKKILSIAIKSLTGTVILELKDDHAGALVTATNLQDESLVYSAITNSVGSFSLAGMKSGEYLVTISNSGYNTRTLSTIETTSAVHNIGSINLDISRGKISGQVKLEGWDHHDGAEIKLVDTEYVAFTDAEGIFEFNVPTGNYPGGLILSKTDFETLYLTDTLTVISGTTFAIKEKDVMLKATHTTVKGAFDIKGKNDNSGIEITFGGHQITTGEDGSWKFEHVKLGSYFLEALYENIPDYRNRIEVTPGEEVDVGTIVLLPQAASVEGVVRLKDMGSSEGILVTATNNIYPDEVVQTFTDINGAYYLSNLTIADDIVFTLTFSKNGWDAQSTEVSDLMPLEVRELEMKTLIDTTTPILNKVVINNGTLVTSNPNVTVTLDTQDQGSKVAYMQLTWLDDFSASSWIPFIPSLSSEIIAKANKGLNGVHTLKVRVRDTAGNISNELSASIELTDQIKTIQGMLSDSELHWVENDPYVVSGDIIVPTGKELIIDPGVQVYFLGNYGISVRGTITAKGTKAKPIVFEPAKDNLEGQSYYGMWEGIHTAENVTFNVRNEKFKFTLEEGSILENVIIRDTEKGITGKIFLKDSEIKTDGWALGGFYGYAVGNTIVGNISISSARLFNNKLKGHYPSTHLNKDFNGSYYSYLWNNLIENYYDVYFGEVYSFSNNTFDNCGSLFIYWGIPNAGYMSANVISNITNPIELRADKWNASFNNIISEITNPLVKVTRRYGIGDFDWTKNYWGEARTRELENIVGSSTSQKSPSFIYDGFDDFNLATVYWSNFAKEPWGFAGYQGDDYITISAKLVRPNGGYNEPYYGKPVNFSITEETQVSIKDYRIGQTIEELLNSSWRSYTGSATINSIDNSLVKDGVATVYIQGRSAQGTETPIETVTFGYDLPQITYCTISEGDGITSDANLEIGIKAKDYTPIDIGIYLNGSFIRNYGYYYPYDNEIKNIHTFGYADLINGEHKIELVPKDDIGNIGETYTANFTVDRPLPYVSELSLTEGAEVGEGEALPVELTIKNAKHLKKVRLLANNNEMYSKSFNDKDSDIQTIETSIDSAYLPNGSNEFIVEMIDFAGNVTRSDSIGFTVLGSPIPPAITTFDLEEGLVYTGDSFVTVTVKAEDVGGVKDIRLYIIDEESVEEEIFSLPYNRYSSGTAERTEQISLMLGYMKNGAYEVRVEAEDFAGNISTESRNITINRPPLIISMTKHTESNYFRYYVSSSSGNNRRFYVYLDGVPYGYSTSGAYFYFYFDRLTAGEHTVEVILYDQAGNISTASDTFTIEGEVSDSSQYGKGVSWSDGGSLLADYATEYLWTFENKSVPGKEEVYGLIDVRVDEITEGIGKAAKVYVNTPIDFIAGSWTVEYWVKGRRDTSELKLTGLVRSYGYDRSSYYYNRIEYPYKNIATNENTSDYYYRYLYDPDIQEQWHHVAIVSTGSELCYYVDGIMRHKSSGAIQLSREATNLYIDGIFDEIRISNKARSKDEIWAYYDYVVKNNLINQ